LNFDRRRSENFEGLIDRRNLGFRGRFLCSLEILDHRPLDRCEDAMDIDFELVTTAFSTPLTMEFF
jgi:hypothetical protein